MKNRRVWTGRLLIAAGLLFIMLAVLMTAYRLYRSYQSEQFMKRLLPDLEEAMPENAGTASERMDALGSRLDLPVLEIDGTDCVGILSIPVLDGSWAVGSVDENTADLPCVRSDEQIEDGMASHKLDGGDKMKDAFLVIQGMDYQNQFAMLNQLTEEDEVRFKDVAGNEYVYKVVFAGSMEELNAAGLGDGGAQKPGDGGTESGDGSEKSGDGDVKPGNGGAQSGNGSAQSETTGAEDTILSRIAAEHAGTGKPTLDLELLVYTSSAHPLIIGCTEVE
jgi:hypothetical protein